jgi:sporulation protein YlmC with PRC-barrel domain
MLEMGDKSSKLFGATVHTSDGEDVARIDDLVIDSTNGHVVYAVLIDVGSMTDRMVAVPFSDLSRKSENVFALDTTRDHLLAAPVFNWDNMNDLAYASEIYRYFGLQPYWE